MKIVDRKTFLAMPAGTLFAKWEPNFFRELTIKDATVGDNDFIYQDLIPWFVDTTDCTHHDDQLMATRIGASSPPLDLEEGTSRDGFFDADQLFAVFEQSDVEALIARLQRALTEGYAGTPQEQAL
jgi:hypothetical protein